MKLKRVLICVAAFLLACSFGLTSRVSVKAEGENIGNFSEDFENYTVGGYIEADELFKQNWVNNVLKGGEAQGMDSHLINIAKVEYETGNSGNKVLHLNNTVGNDSFFHIGPSGDYRVKNFTVSFRLKYLTQGVSERSWVGISFRKKAEVHYTGTNNLMFTTQRYKEGAQITGHAYAIINGGNPNDLAEPGFAGLFGDALSVEKEIYTVPNGFGDQDLPWVEYKLVAADNNYKIYVNNTLVLDCTYDVPTYDYYGYLSLNCCQANVLVDDFTVINNDTEFPPVINPVDAPVLTFNQETNRVEWEAVENANLYAVYVNGELMTTKPRTYYEIASDLAAGTYSVQVKAVSADTFVAKDSELSAAYTFTVEPPVDNSKKGCNSAISGTSLAFIMIGAAAFASLRKKENA